MVFPVDCYPNNDLILRRLVLSSVERPIKSSYVIDLRHFFGDDEYVLAYLRLAAYDVLKQAKINVHLLKDLLQGKYVDTKGWPKENVAAFKKYISDTLEHAKCSLGLFRQIIQKINSLDFGFLTEAANFDEADFESNTIFCDEPKKAILKIAQRYGLIMLIKLQRSCKILSLFIGMVTPPTTIKILFADIPEVLCWGVKKAVQNNGNTIVILSTREASARAILVDLSINNSLWFREAWMFLNTTNEIFNFPGNKVVLINPSLTQREKFKKHNKPWRYMVISNSQGVRFFQCRDGIYQEVSAKQALSA